MSDGSFVSPAARARVRALAVPIAVGLGRLGLTPNGLTVIGFAIGLLAALAAAGQLWILAGLLVVFGGVFDLFDGALARATGRVSAFGGFLDSTLDRWGESLIYVGVIAGCLGVFNDGAVLAALAVTSASLVTYTRARAEAAGLHGEVGIAPRSERLAVLAVGLVVTGLAGGVGPYVGLRPGDWISLPGDHRLVITSGQPWLALALAIVFVTSTITVIQRIWHVRGQAPGAGEPRR